MKPDQELEMVGLRHGSARVVTCPFAKSVGPLGLKPLSFAHPWPPATATKSWGPFGPGLRRIVGIPRRTGTPGKDLAREFREYYIPGDHPKP